MNPKRAELVALLLEEAEESEVDVALAVLVELMRLAGAAATKRAFKRTFKVDLEPVLQ